MRDWLGPIARFTVMVGIAFVPALAMAVSGQFPLVLESLTVGLLSMFRGAGRILIRSRESVHC